MKKYVCAICGYVHTGDEPPAVCPVCGAGADKFNEMAAAPAAAPSAPAAAPQASGREWADEHRVGHCGPAWMRRSWRCSAPTSPANAARWACIWRWPCRASRGLSGNRPVLGKGRVRRGGARREVCGAARRGCDRLHSEEPADAR